MRHLFFSITKYIVILSVPFMAWADEACNLRNTTAQERALYDWVDSDFPRLLHTSTDYVRVESAVDVTRNSTCSGVSEPMSMNSKTTFVLDGKALEASQQQMQLLSDQATVVVEKMQENIKAGMSVMAASDIMEPEIQRIDRERARISARDNVKVRADINRSSAECQGEKVKLENAVAACRLDNEDHTTQLVALFGAWAKGDGGEFTADFDQAPSHRIQTIAITITAAGEALDAALQKTDWATIRSRIQP